jgi:hypothetical protein
MLDDALNGAVFSRSVASLKNNEYPVSVLNDVPVHLDEFDLKAAQFLLVRSRIVAVGVVIAWRSHVAPSSHLAADSESGPSALVRTALPL